MIKVKQEHVVDLKRYLEQDKYINLFLLGDLEQFGLDSAYQDFYIDVVDGEICGVIFRFLKDSLHLYVTKKTDKFINKCEELLVQTKFSTIMIGEKTQALLGDAFEGFINDTKITTLSVYEKDNQQIDTSAVEQLTISDAEKIHEFNNIIFEKKEGSEVLKRLQQDIKLGNKIVYGIKKSGNLVAAGSICAESKFSAMIIGVGTLPEVRNQGFATAVVKKISDDLWAHGKKAVLFYDNPKAASIYEKIGFTPHQKYYMNNLDY